MPKESSLPCIISFNLSDERYQWVLICPTQIVDSCLSSSPCPDNGFAERFKYDVISSSLLSTSISSQASATRRSFSPDLPGKLDSNSTERSASPSEVNHLSDQQPDQTSPSSDLLGDYFWPFTLTSSAVVFLSSGWYLFAMLLFASASYSWHCHKQNNEKADALTTVSFMEFVL